MLPFMARNLHFTKSKWELLQELVWFILDSCIFKSFIIQPVLGRDNLLLVLQILFIANFNGIFDEKSAKFRFQDRAEPLHL